MSEINQPQLLEDVRNIWISLTPEDIEYVRTHYNVGDDITPFGRLGDIMDQNELYPNGDFSEEHIAYCRLVADTWNKEFINHYKGAN